MTNPFIGARPVIVRFKNWLGFTKLVRRDDGVYENVTARDGESKVMHRDKPETLPDLSKTIRD